MQEMAYRVYVTDSIYLYSHDKIPAKRYWDYLHPLPEVDGDEIALSVISKLKG